MRLQLEPTNAWRLHDAPFPFQQTYATPLEDLPRFVRTLLAPFNVEKAVLRIETIVFTPNELITYLGANGVLASEAELNRTSLFAETPTETAQLLAEVLAQWIDFAFFPEPRTFTIYADNDEYTTIFTKTEDALTALRAAMTTQGFKAINDWQWTGPHSLGKNEEGIHV